MSSNTTHTATRMRPRIRIAVMRCSYTDGRTTSNRSLIIKTAPQLNTLHNNPLGHIIELQLTILWHMTCSLCASVTSPLCSPYVHTTAVKLVINRLAVFRCLVSTLQGSAVSTGHHGPRHLVECSSKLTQAAKSHNAATSN